MEKDINIAAILEDKPTRTKLYSPLYGEVFLSRLVSNNGIRVLCKGLDGSLGTDEKPFWENGKFTLGGEICLFPSKKMRDWSKFAWKKGDVLSDDGGRLCIFKSFAHSSYLTFKAKLIKHEGPFIKFDTFLADTKDWHKTSDDVAKEYIVEIEKKYNGKLNLETLEIEEIEKQPEFKDGDIVVAEGENKGKKIFIFRYKIRDSNTDEHGYKSYINVNSDGSLFNNMTFYLRKDFVYRSATDSEKQQLFESLAKENKVWDAEKKQIVNLKPKKCEFKPFDKVLCRNSKDDTWEADFFARLTRKEIDYIQSGKYLCVGDLWMHCIPYNEQTAHLLGTTDEWKGGEV